MRGSVSPKLASLRHFLSTASASMGSRSAKKVATRAVRALAIRRGVVQPHPRRARAVEEREEDRA
eukprot:11162001-Lingulodinium_polyedra.AAC.1